MSVNYTVQAEVIDIRSDAPKNDDILNRYKRRTSKPNS
ncbi:hypothetical protein NIES4103_13690 [Nostoc sp. NIES-4103]|nr:hypothetical protein NIES4103_13690 [Nostoc sp. NIES-4103]